MFGNRRIIYYRIVWKNGAWCVTGGGGDIGQLHCSVAFIMQLLQMIFLSRLFLQFVKLGVHTTPAINSQAFISNNVTLGYAQPYATCLCSSQMERQQGPWKIGSPRELMRLKGFTGRFYELSVVCDQDLKKEHLFLLRNECHPLNDPFLLLAQRH